MVDLNKMTDRDAVTRALAQMQEAGLEMADAKKVLSYLDEQKKAIIAQEEKLAANKGVEGVSAQTREAYASGRYDQWTRDHSAAVGDYERARVKYEGRQKSFEAWRTVVSTERTLKGMER